MQRFAALCLPSFPRAPASGARLGKGSAQPPPWKTARGVWKAPNTVSHNGGSARAAFVMRPVLGMQFRPLSVPRGGDPRPVPDSDAPYRYGAFSTLCVSRAVPARRSIGDPFRDALPLIATVSRRPFPRAPVRRVRLGNGGGAFAPWKTARGGRKAPNTVSHSAKAPHVSPDPSSRRHPLSRPFPVRAVPFPTAPRGRASGTGTGLHTMESRRGLLMDPLYAPYHSAKSGAVFPLLSPAVGCSEFPHLKPFRFQFQLILGFQRF